MQRHRHQIHVQSVNPLDQGLMAPLSVVLRRLYVVSICGCMCMRHLLLPLGRAHIAQVGAPQAQRTLEYVSAGVTDVQ
ncbi:MAG: hypothetical protein DLM70_15350 [Chloroflexi bacterium]|nr:MAG: hypothetical protein DLM70_15350 [Chloroflexota bacterium]